MNKAEENENKLAAQRYAKALLELAGDDKLFKDKILAELTDITLSVKSSDDLKRVMTSPVISIAEKKNVITKLFGTKTDNILLNFLHFLIDKNRFSILESITKEYKNEINRLNNLITISVTSAITLTEAEKSDIKMQLSDILKKNIEPEWSVNPEIIAGLVFEAGDNIVDNSLRHKLQDLSRNIIK
ncbi:MAG: ATP synthase F1 subunit delta [Candidatus Gastranaerophilales bacterium]|nr:ATP synthase F1 subunit delta [Candidatus Gastranaerophilales bacterium]